ncbi:ATP-grasp domain-containing protein [Streptomyces sp. NPDC059783]|uniref:ATP-grasp domain-containing protein n=1 Tax=Streptomyces sp. NPDC059783 TaxID=3346944 RepID=UPI0036618B88
MQSQVYVISGESVAAWLPHFCAADLTAPRLVVAGKDAGFDTVRDVPDGAGLVFVSDHDTLARDVRWAAALRRAGRAVRCQSADAVALALDKVEMKAFLHRNEVATPAWSAPGHSVPGWPAAETEAVWKRRTGTQSQGIRLGLTTERPADDEYGELYREGVEYSVNVFAGPGGVTALPPVWKGPTSRELVPPWRRTRLCGPTAVGPGLARHLTGTAARLARDLGADGFLEVEYLVGDDGEPHVLEINPRVSGTLRMAALAAAEPVFSWYDAPAPPGALPALRHVVEVPNPGPQLIVRELGVYATSRLTVAGDTPEELADRIGGLHELGLLPGFATRLLGDAATAAVTAPATTAGASALARV